MNLTRRYGIELFSNYAPNAPRSRTKYEMRAVAGMFDEPIPIPNQINEQDQATP